MSKITDSSQNLLNSDGGIMNEWKKHKFLLLFSGAKTHVTASYAGVVGSSPTEKEQKFVLFLFIHNPPYLYLDQDN